MGKRPLSTSYDVGYAKPPKSTRYKPGQSGNPRGRPKGVPNKPLPIERLKLAVQKEAYRKVTLNERGRPVRVTVVQAIIRTMAVEAAKGKAWAQKLITEHLSAVEAEEHARNLEAVKEAGEYKQTCQKIIERAKLADEEPPELVPHPDDIELDLYNVRVSIVGPRTREEKDWLDWYRKEMADLQRELAELEAKLEGAADSKERSAIRRAIGVHKRWIEVMKSKYPKAWRPFW